MRLLSVRVSPRHRLLAILFGLLGAAAFPPVGLWPLSLVSIAGFLYLLDDRSAWEALALGLFYGIVYALGTMYWFFGMFGVVTIPLIVVVGCYFGILAALIGATRGRPLWLRAVLSGLFAVAVEWVRGDCWYLRFPWYTVPHALAAAPAWIAAARWIGTFGLSFMVWSVAAGGAFGRLYIWAALLLLPVFSWLLPPVGHADRRALLIQADETQRLEMIIREVPNTEVDLAVLPEYAYLTWPEQVRARPHGPGYLARRLRCSVVFGAVEGDHGQPHFQNVAAVLAADSHLLDTFPKQRPVPLMWDGDPGNRRPVFPVDGGTLGVGVCYDFDAQEVAADLVRRGSTVLVVPTHDSPSWGWVRNYHHGLLLRLRAVETDRWVLRAVNTGRSESIDPHGVPSGDGVDMGREGFVVVGFAHRSGTSLGVWAHSLGPTAALLAVVLLIWSGSRAWHRGSPIHEREGDAARTQLNGITSPL